MYGSDNGTQETRVTSRLSERGRPRSSGSSEGGRTESSRVSPLVIPTKRVTLSELVVQDLTLC